MTEDTPAHSSAFHRSRFYSLEDHPTLFHIGEVFSAARGIPVAPAERPELPNGEKPQAWFANIAQTSGGKAVSPLASVADIEKAFWEHMTGRVLASASLKSSERREMHEALCQEYPWLTGIEIPTNLYRGSDRTQAEAREKWLAELEAKHGSWLAVPMLDKYKGEWTKRLEKGNKGKTYFHNITSDEARDCVGTPYDKLAQTIVALSRLRGSDNQKKQCVIPWQDIKYVTDGPRGAQIMIECQNEAKMTRRYGHLRSYFDQAGLISYIMPRIDNNSIYIDAERLANKSAPKSSRGKATEPSHITALDHLVKLTRQWVEYEVCDPTKNNRSGKRGR